MIRTILATSCLLLVHTVTLAADSNIIYLTRHAEKQSTGTDPGLTEQGQQRAHNIAVMLKRADIDAIYSTDYNRTQQTAKPLSDAIGVAVQSYNPSQLSAFAQQLKGLTGNTLVVGHSNTTPELINLIGGQATPITESEFDRLYQISIDNAGKVTTVLLTSLPSDLPTTVCDQVTLNKTGLSAATGNWLYETLDVPNCATKLDVTISGGSGDADLYLRYGSTPTESTYECRPWKDGNIESCSIDQPRAGTWHIGLHGYKGYSNLSLNAVSGQ